MGKTDILDLVAVEVWYPIDDDPRKGATKVDDLVHDEGHDTGGEDIVLHVGIPGGPETLGGIEMRIVLGDLFVLVPVGDGLTRDGS
jgi:hypothetical protein